MAVTPSGRIGLGGGVELIHGTFTHTGAASEETLVVDGVCTGAGVLHNSSTEDIQTSGVSISSSTSGYKTTLTFNYNAGVAAGRFWILVMHGS